MRLPVHSMCAWRTGRNVRAGSSNGASGATPGSLRGILEAVPIMAFAYQCHVQAVPLFHELDTRPSLLLPWHRAGVGLDPAAMRAGKPANRASLGIETAHVHSNADIAATGGGRSDLAAASLRSRSTDLPPSPRHGGGGGSAAPLYLRSGSAAQLAALVPHAPAAVPAAKLRGMMQVLAVAYIMCTVLYETTGVAGFVLFGDAAQSNVLNNFSAHDVLMQLVNTLVGLAGVCQALLPGLQFCCVSKRSVRAARRARRWVLA